MAADTFVVFAASYDTLAKAEADYHAVRELYQASGLIDTYDAAVITRDDAGKVSIVAKHVTAGPRRADLKDLGEQLDDGHSGLVVVAASDLADRVGQAIRHASRLTSKQLTADETALERDIDTAMPSPAQSQDESYRQAVAQAEAAVAEAEAAAAAAEREAERYSAFRPPRDSGAGDFTG